MADVKKPNKRMKRKDSLKNKAKVTKVVLKSPLKTQREIAKEAGVSKTTVHNKLTNLDQTKDDRILGICEKDIEIVKLGQEIINTRLKDIKKSLDDDSIEPKEKISARDISGIIKENTARYTLFMGDRTDNKGGEKIISINDLYDKEE